MDKQNYFITKNNKSDNFKELVDEAISQIEQLNMGDGSALVPSYGFTSSPSTGIYLGSGHHINFTSLGSQRFHIADDHIRCYEPLRLSATDSPALTFTGDLNTGLKWNGNQDMMFITGGLNKLQVSSSFITCYDAPLFIYSNTPSVGQKITFYGYNFSNPQVGTDILQQCAVGNNALEFTPTTSGLLGTDIIYRWKTGGSNLMEFSNRAQLLQTSGSVSVPAYSFQASGNAGLYYSSGLAFSHGSVQRMLISNSGVRMGASGSDVSTLRYGSAVNSGSTSYSPSFGFTFASAPHIQAVLARNDTGNQFIIQLLSVGTTSFSYRLVVTSIANPSQTYAGTDGHTIYWTAIGS